MSRTKITSIIVAGALVLVGLTGAISYRVVNAQSAATSATPNASTSSTTTQAGVPGSEHGMRDLGYTEQNLADALGIDLATLQAAEQSATTEALKEAVAAGLITQTQADQFTQRTTNGGPCDGLPFLQDSSIDYNSLLAKALNITTDQLQAARQKAYFAVIDQAVKDGTLTQAQADLAEGNFALNNNASFQTAMKSAYTTAVNQAVADGVITQAQADQLIANYHAAGPGGMGGFGGHHGRGGGFDGGNSSSNSQGTPSTTTTP